MMMRGSLREIQDFIIYTSVATPKTKGKPVRTVELTDDEAKDTAYLGLLTAKKVQSRLD